MDVQTSGIEPVNLSDILRLASWDRPRSNEELRNFVNLKHDALSDISLSVE